MGNKFSYSCVSWAPAALADATNLTDQKYMGIQGAAAPFTALVQEIMEEGEAAAAAQNIMVFGRDSTVGVTLSNSASSPAARTAALHPGSAASRCGVAAAGGYNTATTKPQRSATLGALLTLSLQAYGGVNRWMAFPGEEIVIVGATASFGECSLSAFTGSGVGQISSHIVWEES